MDEQTQAQDENEIRANSREENDTVEDSSEEVNVTESSESFSSSDNVEEKPLEITASLGNNYKSAIKKLLTHLE